MVANFNLPTVDTTYTAFPTQIIENIDAALQMLSVGSPSNIPDGAIKWDADNNKFVKKSGGSFNNHLSSTYNFTNIEATQVSLGDSEQIRLGAGNDLKIFHSGSSSIIRDSGTGGLQIQGSQVNIQNSDGSENMAEFLINNAVRLFYNNNEKFTTSSVGCSITGALVTSTNINCGTNIETDGNGAGQRYIKVGTGRTASDHNHSYIDLIGDSTYTTYGLRVIRGNTGANATSNVQHRGTNALVINAVDAGSVQINTNGSARARMTSAGLLGIGTTTPARTVDVAVTAPELALRSTAGSSQDSILRMRGSRTSASDLNQIIFETNDTGGGYLAGSRLGSIIGGKASNNQTRGFIKLNTNRTTAANGTQGTTDTTAVYINQNGEVGINTTSPNRLLEISSSDQTSIIRLANTDTTITDGNRIGRVEFHGSDAGASGSASFIEAVANGAAGAADLRFATGVAGNAAEVARFNKDGIFLLGHDTQRNSRVGTNNISPNLQIHGDTNASISVTRYVNSTASGRLHIQKARGTAASPLVANDGDAICDISMSGYDGSNFTNGVRLIASINGTVASNAMPTDLKFQIRDDSGSLNTNYVMTHDRFFGIIKTSPTLPLHVKQLADDAGVLRLEDKDSGTKYADFDITNGNLSITARNAGTSGTFKLFRNNGTASTEVLRTDSSGRVMLNTTTPTNNARLTVNGDIEASGNLTADIAKFGNVEINQGTGSVGLICNDGGGNAMVTFNHFNRTPDVNGTAGRIVVNVDNTNDDFAEFQFELEHNAVSGTVVDTTPAFGIFRGKASSLGGSGNTVYNQVRIPVGTSSGSMVGLAFSNDLDTGLCRVGSNHFAAVCGGVQSASFHNASVTVRGELNLVSQDESPATKYIDVAFLNNLFQIRRLSGGDAGHTNAMTFQSNLRIDGNFNDTSDGKLKKNVVALADGAITYIKKLKPVTFDWIDETRPNDESGFIAQDVKEVISNVVNGKEYDETDVNEKGQINSVGYSINTIGVLAHVTKALQEAISKIETLETEVATLKAA
jgi:hypothetical protein